ncbi:unnamed protein product [Vitrella brassicaformis CCMP3155]|uniref:CCHC-type domain-containing protein n=1 Tax=Vitrella brassicaformis (strain CCMP3155) TaxID=1169540 RepID=A0A0G4GPZ0_VITBC|nr:unnamed protein product [Vitrella brassicaformis CCMP3155]|eukprot:CEM32439.1 unnamed protein product [Vitrella brassicaformis CCMP3155]
MALSRASRPSSLSIDSRERSVMSASFSAKDKLLTLGQCLSGEAKGILEGYHKRHPISDAAANDPNDAYWQTALDEVIADVKATYGITPGFARQAVKILSNPASINQIKPDGSLRQRFTELEKIINVAETQVKLTDEQKADAAISLLPPILQPNLKVQMENNWEQRKAVYLTGAAGRAETDEECPKRKDCYNFQQAKRHALMYENAYPEPVAQTNLSYKHEATRSPDVAKLMGAFGELLKPSTDSMDSLSAVGAFAAPKPAVPFASLAEAVQSTMSPFAVSSGSKATKEEKPASNLGMSQGDLAKLIKDSVGEKVEEALAKQKKDASSSRPSTFSRYRFGGTNRVSALEEDAASSDGDDEGDIVFKSMFSALIEQKSMPPAQAAKLARAAQEAAIKSRVPSHMRTDASTSSAPSSSSTSNSGGGGRIQCYECKGFGHIAAQCPNRKNAQSFAQPSCPACGKQHAFVDCDSEAARILRRAHSDTAAATDTARSGK